MTQLAIYIGEEASAAGYRLAGFATVMPDAGRETSTFAQALEHATIVLVSSTVAARIDPARLRSAFAAMSPLVAIVPALDPSTHFPDVATQLRAEIGLSS